MRPAPLSTEILFRIGPVAVSDVVVTTWAIVAALGIASWLATRRLQVHPGRTQVVLEAIVTGISAQIRDAIRSDPQPFLPASPAARPAAARWTTTACATPPACP